MCPHPHPNSNASVWGLSLLPQMQPHGPGGLHPRPKCALSLALKDTFIPAPNVSVWGLPCDAGIDTAWGWGDGEARGISKGEKV
jgi:hypothetical protein